MANKEDTVTVGQDVFKLEPVERLSIEQEAPKVENKERQPRTAKPQGQVTKSKLPQGRTNFDRKSFRKTQANRPALFDCTKRRMNQMRSRISETTFNKIDMSEMRKL
ncbi:hypothetical protein PtB15_1B321 [Puccinia triticina]|nr:hypothetical protein PtB15_1B321 [Puccinia triticina]